MLAPAIRRSVPCNLRRIVACLTYRNKMRAKIAWQCNVPSLLSTSIPNVATCRVYSTESDSKPRHFLPMLAADAVAYTPSLLVPFRLFFLTHTIIPQIDKEFTLSEILKGAKYAITIISKALANEDYDSLEGLVEEGMIEVLRRTIQTLNPEQRWLIAVNEEDIVFSVLCDISARAEEEHSIQFKVICHYIPGMVEKKKMLLEQDISFKTMSKLGDMVVCNYAFTRKYINNVGGPWIATFVNHFSMYFNMAYK